MKREDVIQLAREACDKTKVDAFYNGYWTITQDELERVIHLAIEKAVAEERERCASVIEGRAVPQGEPVAWLDLSKMSASAMVYATGWKSNDKQSPLYAATPAPAQEPAVPQGWTDADSDAARLALELECLLLDTETLSVVSKWWASANEALELHRQRLATLAAPSQEPVNRPQNCGTSYCSCIECVCEPSQPVTLTESERVRCLIKAGCIGTVKMTYDSGPYEITRTSINADRLIEAIIAALREKERA